MLDVRFRCGSVAAVARVILWSAFMRHVIAFLRDERAATAIEYGLIATGIAVAIIPVLTGVGSKTKAAFTLLQTALK
jgi:pilus assembly protein Flp/PilA